VVNVEDKRNAYRILEGKRPVEMKSRGVGRITLRCILVYDKFRGWEMGGTSSGLCWRY
jgi:hypothetical protein